MRKPNLIPASLDVRERNVVTHGQWLCGEMQSRGITNIELFMRMSRLGFSGQSANIVSMWRADACRVALDTLPMLLEALGMGEEARHAWVVHYMVAKYPALAPYLRGAA